MRVVIHAQDLSGRRDDGYYTKSDISTALDIFFDSSSAINYSDADAEHVLTRQNAEGIFGQDGQVTFFNADGEKVVITLDPSKTG